MALAQPIAAGRTAEVFAWGDGRILKLLRPGMPERIGRAEAAAMAIAMAARLAVPRLYETVRVEGRFGLVYERVEGRSMMDTLARRPWLAGRLAGQFAGLQASMHNASGAGLPDLRGHLEQKMERAGEALPAEMKAAARTRLAALPDGDAICHGDMHPGNVLMTSTGPLAIDWLTVTRGDPAADVARTLYLLTEARIPGETGILERSAVTAVRRLFARSYLRSYRRLRAVDPGAVAAWRPVVLAARLSEGIEAEREALVRMLRVTLAE